jgi:hypothetical protein
VIEAQFCVCLHLRDGIHHDIFLSTPERMTTLVEQLRKAMKTKAPAETITLTQVQDTFKVRDENLVYGSEEYPAAVFRIGDLLFFRVVKLEESAKEQEPWQE